MLPELVKRADQILVLVIIWTLLTLLVQTWILLLIWGFFRELRKCHIRAPGLLVTFIHPDRKLARSWFIARHLNIWKHTESLEDMKQTSKSDIDNSQISKKWHWQRITFQEVTSPSTRRKTCCYESHLQFDNLKKIHLSWGKGWIQCSIGYAQSDQRKIIVICTKWYA